MILRFISLASRLIVPISVPPRPESSCPSCFVPASQSHHPGRLFSNIAHIESRSQSLTRETFEWTSGRKEAQSRPQLTTPTSVARTWSLMAVRGPPESPRQESIRFSVYPAHNDVSSRCTLYREWGGFIQCIATGILRKKWYPRKLESLCRCARIVIVMAEPARREDFAFGQLRAAIG